MIIYKDAKESAMQDEAKRGRDSTGASSSEAPPSKIQDSGAGLTSSQIVEHDADMFAGLEIDSSQQFPPLPAVPKDESDQFTNLTQ